MPLQQQNFEEQKIDKKQEAEYKLLTGMLSFNKYKANYKRPDFYTEEYSVKVVQDPLQLPDIKH